jgi:outer membrane protein assembly factor BamE (lipoprotein component of BamABCDE complex)
MNKNFSLIAVVAFTATCLFGCVNKLNNENLTKIKNGQTEEEVTAILGKPDRIETGETLGLRGTTYYYSGNGAEVKVVFLNNSVMAKEGSFK